MVCVTQVVFSIPPSCKLGVQVVKRMLRENISPQGSLDTDKMARALLAYRNTPCKDLGVSPAQILYGRALRDHLPMPREFLVQRKEWLTMKADREKALSTKYGRIQEDLERHSHSLPPLLVGDVVQVQNQRGKDPLRWDRSGIVVESLGNQQYTVKMDGSGRVTLRNRRFLRKIEPFLPRSLVLDIIPVNHRSITEKELVTGDHEAEGTGIVVDDQVAHGDDLGLRRSTRVHQAPERYEAR